MLQTLPSAFIDLLNEHKLSDKDKPTGCPVEIGRLKRNCSSSSGLLTETTGNV